jgi:uncharacterized protein
MLKSEMIEKTVNFVKGTLKNAEWCHDWFHIYRVWNNAKSIWEWEKVDMLVVELAALLHDIAEPKFHNWDETIWPKVAWDFLEQIWVDEEIIEHVKNIIKCVSFKNSLSVDLNKFDSLELQVVQDADRLDAIWALGIARAFSYWWSKKRALYNPEIKPNLNITKEEYKNSNAPTVNHFYEKLLLLKNKMNTQAWKKIAEGRHEFMEQYLNQFYNEWEWKS